MLTSREVLKKSFTPTQFHSGYDEREVDEFVDRVIETVRYYERGGGSDPQALDLAAGAESEGPAQRAIRWLRGGSTVLNGRWQQIQRADHRITG